MKVQRYKVFLDDGFLIETVNINPGQSRYIVFYHGLGASPGAMYPFLEWLAFMEGVTIIALRMPCHGDSGDVDTSDAFIDRIGQWGEIVGLSNALIIGHSLGALALPFVAKRFPNQIGAGVCLAPPIEPLSSGFDLINRLVHVATDVTITTSVALFEAFRYGDGPRFSRAVRRTASEGFRLPLMMKVFKDFPDFGTVLRELEIPIVFMWGERDSATPPPNGHPDHPIVLAGQHHCFLMLRENWEPIRSVVRAQLDRLSPPQSAAAS